MDNLNKKTLKEMILIKDTLNMEMIYQKIDEYRKKKINLTKSMKLKIKEGYEMEIIYYGTENMQFEINEEFYETFIQPLKYRIVINDSKEIIADIISFYQLSEILKECSFNQLKIYCPQCDNKYFSLKFFNLVNHENHKDVCLKESLPYRKLSLNEFNGFFKEELDFIKMNFKPLKFEPNFHKYFKDTEYVTESTEFSFYPDIYQKRLKLMEEIGISRTVNKLVQFFGQPGKGKTLTLIGILKYMTKHSKIGTLYVNCKAMFNADKPYKLKQLFIDEIPFLFYGDHEGYTNCANEIIGSFYDISSSSFFDLINLIIDIIIKNDRRKKNYLIVLDQYNDKIDKNNNLNKLYEDLILNINNKRKNLIIGLITFSSMNNGDIREYKLNYLFNEKEGIKIEKKFLQEVETLEYQLTIDNGGAYDKQLKKLGNGLKYYNKLNYFHSENKWGDLLDYMNRIECRIRDNLLKFFKIGDFKKNPNIGILSSFSTNVRYSKTKLNEIIKNIPLKYFEIVKAKNLNDEYIIKFSFPLVGEIMNQIFSSIINSNPNLYTNLTKKELDGGAKGKFFEKIVTYHLNIESLKYKNEEQKKILYFEDYPIEFHKEIEVLVLNNDEVLETIDEKQIIEQKGIYLITQKRYNGKALDIALLKIDEINEIIGAQISIHKDEIFSLNEIGEFLMNLRDNLQNYYEIKVEDNNLFFCYIFEWNDTIDDNMIRQCKNKGIKYFFFDVTNQIFKNRNGKIITKLKPNICRPIISSSYKITEKGKKLYHSLDEYFSNLKIIKSNYNCRNFEKEPKANLFSPTLKGPIFKINEAQEKSIKYILKREFNLVSAPEITYTFSMKSLPKKGLCDFSISRFVNEKDEVGMFTRLNSYYSIKSNGDISNRVSNTVQEFDCYEINYYII